MSEERQDERNLIETRFWSMVDRDGLTGLPSDMWGALDQLVRDRAARQRAERNRDMWKGQCERQATELTTAAALLSRAYSLASQASTLDWNEDRNVMGAIHLAGDIRAFRMIPQSHEGDE